MIVDVGDVLRTGAEAAADAVGRQAAEVGEKVGAIDAVMTSARAALEEIAERTDRAIGGLGQRLRSLEGEIGKLPTTENYATVAGDLGVVASNVNEIWMRVRTLLQATEGVQASLEEEKTASAERLDRRVRRLDELIRRVEERVASRIGELEDRLAKRGVGDGRSRGDVRGRPHGPRVAAPARRPQAPHLAADPVAPLAMSPTLDEARNPLRTAVPVLEPEPPAPASAVVEPPVSQAPPAPKRAPKKKAGAAPAAKRAPARTDDEEARARRFRRDRPGEVGTDEARAEGRRRRAEGDEDARGRNEARA